MLIMITTSTSLIGDVDECNIEENEYQRASIEHSKATEIGEKITYKYDEDGKMTEENHYNTSWGGEDGELDLKIKYKYDNEKNLIELNRYGGEGDKLTKEEYKYETTWYIVLPRVHWYDFQKKVFGHAREHAATQTPLRLCSLEAIPYQINPADFVARNCCCEALVVWVTPHNPSKDLHILALADEAKKSGKSVCLIVILPVFDYFVEALRSIKSPPLEMDVRQPVDRARVRTIADFLTWLEYFRLVFFDEWVLLLPYIDYNLVVADQLFQNLQRTWSMRVRRV